VYFRFWPTVARRWAIPGNDPMPTATTDGSWEYNLVSVYCTGLARLRAKLTTAPEAPIKLRGNLLSCILKPQQARTT
jgi:hypothetical protein